MKDISSLTGLGLNQKTRMLVLMPHPDDEAVFISGLLQKLSSSSIPTRAVTVTAGEKSTLRYTLAPEVDLATARKKELNHAYALLGVTDYKILSLPDGALEHQTPNLYKIITAEVKHFKPTHLVTLEPDGIYGHPDHIALSRAVAALVKPPIKLLYATVASNYIFPKARAMANKPIIKPLLPQFRLRLTLEESYIKIRALLSHRSQFFSPLPILKSTYHFFQNDMLFHEYFTYKTPAPPNVQKY